MPWLRRVPSPLSAAAAASAAASRMSSGAPLSSPWVAVAAAKPASASTRAPSTSPLAAMARASARHAPTATAVAAASASPSYTPPPMVMVAARRRAVLDLQSKSASASVPVPRAEDRPPPLSPPLARTVLAWACTQRCSTGCVASLVFKAKSSTSIRVSASAAVSVSTLPCGSESAFGVGAAAPPSLPSGSSMWEVEVELTLPPSQTLADKTPPLPPKATWPRRSSVYTHASTVRSGDTLASDRSTSSRST
mmetsp:Transcript_29865/g.74733  ORF Transcript_29865/g.74733 Transcript_29865/m.74733 type:complete len:251 (+) Transcript_29865:1957-2709(+)